MLYVSCSGELRILAILKVPPASMAQVWAGWGAPKFSKLKMKLHLDTESFLLKRNTGLLKSHSGKEMYTINKKPCFSEKIRAQFSARKSFY